MDRRAAGTATCPRGDGRGGKQVGTHCLGGAEPGGELPAQRGTRGLRVGHSKPERKQERRRNGLARSDDVMATVETGARETRLACSTSRAENFWGPSLRIPSGPAACVPRRQAGHTTATRPDPDRQKVLAK